MRCSSQLTLAAALFVGSAVLVANARAATTLSEAPDKAVGPPELHLAARAGDLTALESHISRGADPDARDAAGRTALMEGVRAGQVEAVRLLIAVGASVDAATMAGR